MRRTDHPLHRKLREHQRGFARGRISMRVHPDEVYAVIRHDKHDVEIQHAITVKEIVRTREMAEAEVARLNSLVGHEAQTYWWQYTRLFPPGESFGTHDGAATRRTVDSRERLLDVIFELLDDNDAVPWKNDRAYTFLQAMAEWLDKSDSDVQPTWQTIAEMLEAAGR